MKFNIWIPTAAVLVLVVASVIGCGNDSPTSPAADDPSIARNALAQLLVKGNAITATQAIEIALGKVNGAPVEVELEKEDGKLIFVVEVDTGNGITEIEIDTSNGDVIEVEEEDDDEDGINHTLVGITLEQAIDIATAEVPGDLIEAELDNENNMLLYEVAIGTADGVLDVKLDAEDGTVIKIETDDDEDNDDDGEDADDDEDDDDDDNQNDA